MFLKTEFNFVKPNVTDIFQKQNVNVYFTHLKRFIFYLLIRTQSNARIDTRQNSTDITTRTIFRKDNSQDKDTDQKNQEKNKKQNKDKYQGLIKDNHKEQDKDMNTDQHKDIRARTMVSQNKNHHKNQKNMDQDQIKDQDPAKDKEQRSPAQRFVQ